MSSDDSDTRERILATAGPIFADRGFQGATVRDICQAAGVNQAAINYYFGDKERLYIETVTRAHRLGAQRVPLPQWPPGTPPQTRLADFVRTLLERMLGDNTPWQSRLMLREIIQPTSACSHLVQDYIRPQFEVLQEILGEMLPASATPAERYQIGFSIVGQCVFYRVAGEVVRMMVPADEQPRHYTPAALAEHIVQFSLAALEQFAPSEKHPGNGNSPAGKAQPRGQSVSR